MPDKNYKKGCGKSCTTCWKNKMNHANKLKENKKTKKTISELSYDHEVIDEFIEHKSINNQRINVDVSLYDEFSEWYSQNFDGSILSYKCFVDNMTHPITQRKFLGTCAIRK